MLNESKNETLTLKELREKAGLTQPQLSQKLNCGIRIIGHWEKGTKLPRFDNALALARVLNVSLKTLAESMRMDTTDIPSDRD